MCSFGWGKDSRGKAEAGIWEFEQEGGLSFGRAQGHPSTAIPCTDEGTKHGENNILQTTWAVGIPSPSPNPSHIPAFIPTTFKGANKAGRQHSGLKGSRNATAGGKREHSTSVRPRGCCSLPAVEGIQTLLLVGHLQLLTAVPGLGALQGSCLLMHRRGTARRHPSAPSGKGKRGLELSICSLQFQPAQRCQNLLVKDSENISATSQVTWRGKKKAIFLPGTPQRSQQSSQIAVAPWDNTLQSKASPP